MGKDGTQLLRHCVRILVLVSTDLIAVRSSGIYPCSAVLCSCFLSDDLLFFFPLPLCLLATLPFNNFVI